MKLTKQQLIEKIMDLKHPSNTRQYNCAVADIASIINDTEVITDPEPVPTIDTELEEAKKRFPVNSWIEDGFCLRQVVGHVREKEGICIKYYTEVSHSGGEPYSEYKELSDCTPATLPTRKINWRCMKTDAPDDSRNVLIKLDDCPHTAWFDGHEGWRVPGFYIDLSKYKTALWCELAEIEGER